MKRHLFSVILAVLAGLSLVTIPGRAEGQLSARNLDALDQAGWLTPAFKEAVHDLVNTKQAIVDTKKAEKDLTLTLPGLKAQADKADADTVARRAQLAEYEHTDESDFAALQKTMTDAGAKPEDQRVLAQAYVWAYPTSTHQAEAQQYLQEAQKNIQKQLLSLYKNS